MQVTYMKYQNSGKFTKINPYGLYYSKASAAAFVVLFVVIINVIIVFYVRKVLQSQ